MNLFAEGLFVKPVWFLRWVPSFQFDSVPSLRLGAESFGLWVVRGHSPQFRSFNEIFFGTYTPTTHTLSKVTPHHF
ncbi:MAG: hypothetical protein LAP13_10165 [Acidobacteriia bacterium]|nr:hypothetical protein [Terriglobia bacterium]